MSDTFQVPPSQQTPPSVILSRDELKLLTSTWEPNQISSAIKDPNSTFGTSEAMGKWTSDWEYQMGSPADWEAFKGCCCSMIEGNPDVHIPIFKSLTRTVSFTPGGVMDRTNIRRRTQQELDSFQVLPGYKYSIHDATGVPRITLDLEGGGLFEHQLYSVDVRGGTHLAQYRGRLTNPDTLAITNGGSQPIYQLTFNCSNGLQVDETSHLAQGRHWWNEWDDENMTCRISIEGQMFTDQPRFPDDPMSVTPGPWTLSTTVFAPAPRVDGSIPPHPWHLGDERSKGICFESSGRVYRIEQNGTLTALTN